MSTVAAVMVRRILQLSPFLFQLYWEVFPRSGSRNQVGQMPADGTSATRGP